jgi:hypothetical protein
LSHESASDPAAAAPERPLPIQTQVWEPGPDGHWHRVRIKTVAEVFTEIRDALGPAPAGAEEGLDMAPWIPNDLAWPPGRIAVFAVTGDSEGHYVHVEVLGSGDRACVGLGKTFQGKDAAWALARRLADLLGA